MQCIRCHGLMTLEMRTDQSACARLPMWRCISCGELIDKLILMNRMNPRRKGLAKRVPASL